MKKNICLLIIFTFVMQLVQAKPVTPTTAKNLAISFYQQHSAKIPQTVSLFYTETSSTGEALYYVFNINSNDGFVIITADDAAHPILGYSTERQFKIPAANTTISYWMKKRKQEIIAIKAANIIATEDIAREWAGDFSVNNNLSQRTSNPNSVATASVAPMVQTTWDQSPYYNALCPGGVGNDGTSANASVTGCVATAMAQVMKFWNYPAQGRDSSSYCDCTSGGYTDNYGILSANYGATTYSWSAMPLNVSSPDSAVAILMYHCGVSVDMDYDPNGSGADALSIETGGQPCSQIALVQYFKYDSATIQGYQKTEGHYSDTAWVSLIKIDLNAGRPVIYEGDDSTQGGHCWVCDGYDVNNNLHMNWGWSGADDGYFPVTNLTTNDGGLFNPVLEQEVLVGIQPPPSASGIASVNNHALGINVYPNPTHNNLFITTDANTTSVSVTDIIGQTVIADQKVVGTQQTQSIDISTLANGVYLVKISLIDNQTKVIKVIKN
jgi:peptidase C10-like protein/Spi protease inhibitor/type IX secretion system substrate protein